VANLSRVISDQTTQFKILLENNNVVCRKCRFGQLGKIGNFPLGTQGHHVKWFNCLKCETLNFDLFKGTTSSKPIKIFTFTTVLSFPTASRAFALPESLPKQYRHRLC
jgi:hypothetical protein